MKPNGAVFQQDGGWWFLDETRSVQHGPYSSKQEAITMFHRYCNYLDKQGWDNKQASLKKLDIDWEFVTLVMVLALFLFTVVVYLYDK